MADTPHPVTRRLIMQAVGASVSLVARIDDHNDICRVVHLYMDGVAKGDVSKLKEAFHADARMFGDFTGIRYDVPIADLLAGRVCGPLSNCTPDMS
jgi:hypothetical protein